MDVVDQVVRELGNAGVQRAPGVAGAGRWFDPDSNTCRIDGRCRLKGVLQTALASYLAVLDDVTLADLVAPEAVRGGTGKRVLMVTGLPR